MSALTDKIIALASPEKTLSQVAEEAGCCEDYARQVLAIANKKITIHGNFSWPKEHVLALEDGFKRGLSMSRIALKINQRFGSKYTRNAVIGKCQRLGLVRAGHNRGYDTFDQLRRSEKRKPRHQTARKPKSQNPWSTVQRPKLVVDNTPISDLPPAIASISFAGLQDGLCKWPVGDPGHPDFGYCGQETVPLSSYCPTCLKRAYIRVPERVKQFLEPGQTPEITPLEAV